MISQGHLPCVGGTSGGGGGSMPGGSSIPPVETTHINTVCIH